METWKGKGERFSIHTAAENISVCDYTKNYLHWLSKVTSKTTMATQLQNKVWV